MAYKNTIPQKIKARFKGGYLVAVIATTIFGLASTLAINEYQPKRSNVTLSIPLHPNNAGLKVEEPSNSLALPLARISVKSAPPATIERIVKITQGDTLISAIMRSGVDRPAAHAAVNALSSSYNPRHLRPGQALTLLFDPKKQATKGHPALVQVEFSPAVDKEIRISLKDDGSFKSETINKPLSVKLYRAEGSIKDSLYLAAKRAGVPSPVIVNLIRIYSFDLDFQRDIQRGDHFELLFEIFYNLLIKTLLRRAARRCCLETH